ncbi:hypothetical protein [Alkalicoccobacillus plakortidis]|uniref:Uncharacterized protein n=1 Tax=Alkalicoccobacillus plakortidis TaxID=444060 RepID=A0ABT0XJJ1_9BACI|nr:hypothetical protein [Alkalicoccobacillus plakortidis]MCM2675538.1 hypothetical protein [Alkalicoccobacillus plakortidis]
MAAGKITFRITGVNFQYDDEGNNQQVDLNFQTSDPEGKLYAGGIIPISPEEHFAASNLTAMAEIVKRKYLERVNGVEEEESTEE